MRLNCELAHQRELHLIDYNSRNNSLVAISCPAQDIAEALSRPDRSRVLSAWERIEALLQRNRSHPDVDILSCQKVLHSLNNVCLDGFLR